MSQFDVHTNPFRRIRERRPFLVVLQSDLISLDFDSIVVAPLQPAHAGNFINRLNPAVTFGSRSFVLITQDLSTMRKSQLGASRGSVRHHRDQIIAALDILFTGI